jgi:hypothetical protein
MNHLSSHDESIKSSAIRWLSEMASVLPHRAAEIFDILTGITYQAREAGTLVSIFHALCRICASSYPPGKKAGDYLTAKMPESLQFFDDKTDHIRELLTLLGEAAQGMPGIADSLVSLYEAESTDGRVRLPVQPLSALASVSPAIADRVLPYLVQAALQGESLMSIKAVSILSDLSRSSSSVRLRIESLAEQELKKECAALFQF